MVPQGGTSRGPAVTTAVDTPATWQNWKEAPSPRERDRAAILHQAGEFRVSFDFVEAIVFEPPFKPDRPYRSWATEKVIVLEEREDFVSLQHILVMYSQDEDGTVKGPHLQKHWRQDWQWEPDQVLEYVGGRTWKNRRLSSGETEGKWSQSVFQVDDSPRYTALGAWLHEGNHATWEARATGRPLPRRERANASQYQRLDGVNRHTVLPLEWVHEEDNLKVRLDPETGEKSGAVSREYGVNRYERIQELDFSAADEYLAQTEPFWSEVRIAWQDKINANEELEIARECDGELAFMSFFREAWKLESGEVPPDDPTIRARARELVDCVATP